MQNTFNEAQNISNQLETLERINNVSHIKMGIVPDEVMDLQTDNPVATALFLYKNLPPSELRQNAHDIVSAAFDKIYNDRDKSDLSQAIHIYLDQTDVFQKKITAHEVVKNTLSSLNL